MLIRSYKHIELMEPSVNYCYEFYNFIKMVLYHPFQPMRRDYFNVKNYNGILIEHHPSSCKKS
jgi:hypothetical protein